MNRASVALIVGFVLQWALPLPANAQSRVEFFDGNEFATMSRPAREYFVAGLLAGLWWDASLESLEVSKPRSAALFRESVAKYFGIKVADVVNMLESIYNDPRMLDVPIVVALVEAAKNAEGDTKYGD